MRNQLAIGTAILALVLAIGALGATIHAFWPSEDAAVSVAFEAFDQAEGAEQVPPPEIGQSKFVGPEQPKATEKGPKPSPKKPTKKRTRKREKWKSAVLQVVANFEEADVRVNGIAYPEYFEPGEPEGMVLPAGGPYDVEVKIGGSSKHYNLYLRANETRLLLVQLSGQGSAPAPPKPKPAKKAPAKKEEKKDAKKDDDGKEGKITVYSKPPGSVLVDGKETGEKTPGSVGLENGRHEVQVKYESGTISEKKIVRVRSGSRIKLFFRERKSK